MSSSFNSLKVPFEHYAPKYRCCCNSVHVKQGTQIVGVIQAVCAVFSLIVFIFSREFDALWATLEVLSVLGEIIVLAGLFFALKKENPRYLLPYLVYEVGDFPVNQILMDNSFFQSLMVLVSVGGILSGITAFMDPHGGIAHIYRTQLVDLSFDDKAEHLNEETAVKLIAAFTSIVFLVAALIYVWWIHVVYKYYIYLKDLNQARESNDLSMRYSPKINMP